MIAGVGVDMASVTRLGRLYARHGVRALEKLLAPAEMADFSKARDPARFLAKRFAAKEAFGKALGMGVAAPATLPNIAVTHDSRGKPTLAYAPPLAQYLKENALSAQLSISDEGDYAVAFVVVEKVLGVASSEGSSAKGFDMNKLVGGLTAEEWRVRFPLLVKVSAGDEVFWTNPRFRSLAGRSVMDGASPDEIDEAEKRLRRFAPCLARLFPETAEQGGLIESPLVPVPNMARALGLPVPAESLYLKCDGNLPIAGSVKARGGVYEVLKTAEDLALSQGGLRLDDDYAILAEESFRRFFSGYRLVVGSTGNLGLSIGIMGARLGFEVTVHMSADARQWKKDLLRAKGAQVVEHTGDYGAAVAAGRREAESDPRSHFVDDENSRDLFLGYATAAGRLKGQLADLGTEVGDEKPLFVYLPCGVGGAPGGLTYGLKTVFGDAAHCFFAEPVRSPSMLLGLMTGCHQEVSVQDFGLDNQTAADGLAVARPSGFVGRNMERNISGVLTVADTALYRLLRLLVDTEKIFLEPSALAGFPGPGHLLADPEGRAYLARHGLEHKMERAIHLVWATGGGLVPPETRREFYNQSLLSG